MDDIHNPRINVEKCKSKYESFGEKEDEEDSTYMVDRISELPDFIIHHILSFLDSPSQVTKTSILSKRWYHSYASFPRLHFLEPWHLVSASEKNNFLNYIEKCLSRYQSNGFRISKFSLRIRLAYNNSHGVSLVYKWIEFLLQNQIEDLHISCHRDNRHEEVSLILPPNFFSTSKLLKIVRLNGCGIESPLCMDQIAFGSLQDLYLSEVIFRDENVISYIISSCPLLEKITLKNFDGLKKLQLYGLDKLRCIDLATPSSELSAIDINALSLQSFSYSENKFNNNTTPRIEMGACKNLRDLSFSNIETHGWQLHDFTTQFPLLESFTLDHCDIEEVQISSECLKKFGLIYCRNLSDVVIKASNLVSFDFFWSDDSYLPLITSTNMFGKWEATLNFYGNLTFLNLDMIRLLDLKTFLLKSKHFKLVTLDNFSFGPSEVDVDAYRQILSSTEGFELDHLKLRVCRISQNYPAALENLLLCCHPNALSLEVTETLTNSLYTTELIKHIYEKLSHEGSPCYGYCRCWSKYVKKVEIKLFDPKSKKRIPIKLAALLGSLPTIKNQEIQFWLNW